MRNHPVIAHLLRFGPHGGAHRVALRAGISVLVPLLVLVLLGKEEWTAYAAFGAFTSLYGRTSGRPERAGMQATAAVALCCAVASGVVVSLWPHHLWWMVGIGSLIAAGGSLLADAWHWHPPGPIFLLFGFAVCATIPGQTIETVPLAFGIAAASALFAMLIGWIGALREPGTWSAPVIHPPTFTEVIAAPNARRHLLRYLLATLVAGAIGLSLGGAHPYWAMVAACAGLAGATLHHRLARSIHRGLGSLAGVLVAGVLLFWHPPVLVLVLYVMVLQVLAELLVGRNYGIALLAITPLALVMGELGTRRPIGQLMIDRAAESVLGAVIAIVALIAIPDRVPAPETIAG